MAKKPLGPKDLYSWSLALYPTAILIAIGYYIVTDKPITTEIVGLFIGLLTAGTLRAALNLNEKESNDDSPYNSRRDDNPNRVRDHGDKTLGPEDRGGPDDTYNRFSIFNGLRFNFLH